jgi:urease accessory protein
MFVVDTHLGNVEADPDLARRVEREGAETVIVDDDRRRRSRFRTETDSGTDVGVVVERSGGLSAGDVLTGDELTVVVELAERRALIVDLADVAGDPETLAVAVAFGHAVGNRHRPLAARGREVLIAADDPGRVEREVESELPSGATTRVEAVDPTLFDHAGPDHSHGESDHDHSRARGDHEHRPILRRPTGNGETGNRGDGDSRGGRDGDRSDDGDEGEAGDERR